MRTRHRSKKEREAARQLRAWVVAHHAWITVKARLSNDCYALSIGSHKHTVVRTVISLHDVSSRLVATHVAEDYHSHLAELILAAKASRGHSERAAGVRPVECH